MRVHTICKTHKTTALVGPGSLLSELECVVCVAISDEQYAASRRPCCSRANIDCCGHDDEYAAEFADEPSFGVAIESPNYCDRNQAADAEVPF
jgi:hypothetical protein